MDHFGIGTALLGCAEVYFRCARRTGRTTSLVESLVSGDRVVCRTENEAFLLRPCVVSGELKSARW